MKRMIVLPFSIMLAFILTFPVYTHGATDLNGRSATDTLSELSSSKTESLADSRETIQNAAFDMANEYRKQMELPLFQSNDLLQKMAQNHADYLLQFPDDGHYERNTDSEGFTGYSVRHRADHVGYTGLVGEGITYQEQDGEVSIHHLFDAPYHRLSLIDPRFSSIGIGYNDSGDFVANYGGDGIVENPRPVVYPVPNQQNVKVSWFANEQPNPLRFFDKNREWTGYPITYRYFGSPQDQLVVEQAKLMNESGEQVDTYNVTPSMEDHGNKHVFLIPKNKLIPGQTYTVDIKARAEHADSTKEDVSKKWEFTTAKQVELDDVYLQTQKQTTFLKMEWASGGDPDAVISLKRNGNTHIEKQDNNQYTYKPIEPGTYTLNIDSPWFNETKKYEVSIKENQFELLEVDAFQAIELEKASTQPVWGSYPEFSSIKEVDKDKVWEITFNEQMEDKALEDGGIYVINDSGEQVLVEIKQGSQATDYHVHPPEGGYETGLHQLIIEPMKSLAGTSMKEGVRMSFSVK
ncbi:CAP domain-containing protein [Halobacillus locisalis]|uniref:CAP domain-containing protein n=1 Tax=Halobacillus locisalis TaxID=220753 RepID=A0A838CX79_9BACI|nr:CAP domain-containing protein [Halobacillus locisalis]MBA2176439.1 CAP domain-containing protein [Halobacillus locisalis]